MAPLAWVVDLDIKAKAALDLSPKGNQVAVSIIFVIASLFLGAAVWLDANDKNFALAGVIGLAFFGLGGFFWWKSHKNESLQKAHPFNLKVGEGSSAVEVSADARSLPALDYLKGILGQYSAIFHREPLPEPSGKIGVDGQPITGTIEQARLEVQASNDIAQRQSNDVAEDICARMNVLASDSPVLGDLASGASDSANPSKAEA
jgi:hypothetical protein